MQKITVDAIIVPPFKCGEGYGHTPDGRCVAFSGERKAMIELSRRIVDCQYAGAEARVISLGGFGGFFRIDVQFCPTAHTQPSAIAS